MPPDSQSTVKGTILIEAKLYHASVSNPATHIPFRDGASDQGHVIGHMKDILSIRILETTDALDVERENANVTSVPSPHDKPKVSERVVLLQHRKGSKIDMMDTITSEQTCNDSIGRWGKAVALVMGSVEA